MLETAWESRWMPDLYGGVAQLGEHLPCKQGVKSSNLSISIRYENTVHVLTYALRKQVSSVACRHAMKSKLHKCLWKQASSTFLKFRFRNVPWKPHIEISNLKYLRYKTSEAYRKIRNRKNQVNTRPGVQRYAPSYESRSRGGNTTG